MKSAHADTVFSTKICIVIVCCLEQDEQFKYENYSVNIHEPQINPKYSLETAVITHVSVYPNRLCLL